jgi:hypothetical protein
VRPTPPIGCHGARMDQDREGVKEITSLWANPRLTLRLQIRASRAPVRIRLAPCWFSAMRSEGATAAMQGCVVMRSAPPPPTSQREARDACQQDARDQQSPRRECGRLCRHEPTNGRPNSSPNTLWPSG